MIRQEEARSLHSEALPQCYASALPALPVQPALPSRCTYFTGTWAPSSMYTGITLVGKSWTLGWRAKQTRRAKFLAGVASNQNQAAARGSGHAAFLASRWA